GEDVADGQDAGPDGDLVAIDLGAGAVLDVDELHAVAEASQQIGRGLAADLGPVGVHFEDDLLGCLVGEDLEGGDAVDAGLELELVVVISDAEAAVSGAGGDLGESAGDLSDAVARRPALCRDVGIYDR